MEPSTKVQHASAVYERRFGMDNHSNRDIASVEVSDIPDHDLLVGGFPCQDYSVATTLKNSKGLIGEKRRFVVVNSQNSFRKRKQTKIYFS